MPLTDAGKNGETKAGRKAATEMAAYSIYKIEVRH